MKRCPYASYQWIIFGLNCNGIRNVTQEMHHLLEPIQGKNELEILEILVTLAQVYIVLTISYKLLFLPHAAETLMLHTLYLHIHRVRNK